ncbi:phage protein [Vibrio genomosp. F6]|uniref:Regulator n=1 Tax=Vibrio genomosp. F6 str. FF-238 TaxID=1191298 RepID=A0A1E5CL88_9VIBR|nr:phage protein [Vibrio genomosp. F6]OEE69465.1 regulator [Vibrio genomosp. F6 str. FF-238]
MHHRKMNSNYIFRKFKCGLSKEETAFLCFKTVRTVTEWDKGKPIPPECKRLMRMQKCRELGYTEEWELFQMHGNELKLPTGQCISPQEILMGAALVEIRSSLEVKTSTKLLKLARAIAKLKNR